MRASVKQPFIDYSMKHEGYTPFMYCDVLNLVTTGVGNLVDAGPRNNDPQGNTQTKASWARRAALNTTVSPAAMAPAMSLPWKHRSGGALLSQSEIAAAWATTKNQNVTVPGFAGRGGGAYSTLTDAILTQTDVAALVAATLAGNENTLRKNYPQYESWPADAQFAVNSISWACGANFRGQFPQLNAALLAQDWFTCIVQGQFQGGGSVTDPASRNHDNAIMFANAANVVKAGADPDQLYFPSNRGTAPASSLTAMNQGPALITSNVTGTEIAVGAAAAAAAGWGIFKVGKAKGWF